jgi:hypothetical protein
MHTPSLVNLLGKGFFPRELPPTFSTQSYANFALGTAAGWGAAARKLWTRCTPHNLARPGGLRRPLKIPNAVSYFFLAELIANHWHDIVNHTWKVRLSASRPYVPRRNARAVVPRYHYGELPRLRILRRRGSRYLLRTDIDQFYPSIYTHAVPWALHTKATCKAALLAPGKGGHLLGNRLDSALQRLNDGQTHGIPIGPDTSLIVAEILLAAVDQILIANSTQLIRGFRHVDDYELSFLKLSQGEEILTALQGLLSDYELFLNPRKTKLSELPAELQDNWSIDLAKFDIRDKGHPIGQRNDLVALFSKALEIAAERPVESVLRYAVARVQRLDVASSGWRTFQNCVLSAASADASTLAGALGTLYEVSSIGGHTVAKLPLAEVFESIIRVHAPRGQGSEVAWALWGALAWSVPLSNDAAKAVSEMEDNVVALLALHADSLGLFTVGALDKTNWSNLVSQPDALIHEHWLLAYEANQQGWLTTPAVVLDPIFSTMSAALVSFYDQTEAKPQFPSGARATPGGRLPHYYA